MKRRVDGVIGRPVHRHVEEAIRDAAFRERMEIVGEVFEFFVWPLVKGLGAVLVAYMLCSFFVAIVTQRGPA